MSMLLLQRPHFENHWECREEVPHYPPESASKGRLSLSEGTGYIGNKGLFTSHSLHIFLTFLVDSSFLFNLQLLKILENFKAGFFSTKQTHARLSARASSVHSPWWHTKKKMTAVPLSPVLAALWNWFTSVHHFPLLSQPSYYWKIK